MSRVRIVIADDHKLYAEALKVLLSSVKTPGIDIVGVAHTGKSLLKLLEKRTADLVLLDLNMPDGSGLDVLPVIKDNYPSMKVIAVTMYDGAKFIKAVLNEFNGDGYFIKTNSAGELVEAIQAVMDGEIYLSNGLQIFPRHGDDNGDKLFEDDFQLRHRLTPRETQILHLISRAKSNKEIADELFISDQTVMVHRKNIMRKLSVSSTAGLIKFAMDHDLA